ncbi:MAG: hypothetical protein C0501_16940 [Isosphaera sp.]|nr:hypothetical protein [Isosphaera sp.]
MSRLPLTLAACLLAPSAGCESIRDWVRRTPRPPGPTGAVQKVSAEQLVGYLNDHAGRLQSLSYGDVTVTVSEGDGFRGAIQEQAALRGSLFAQQPRKFRMNVSRGGLVDAKVDLGSNPEQFWVYFHVPSVQPMYVFASHADFEEGRAKLPDGVPFEPDWVMQALGMTTFPPGPAYQARTDEKARTHTLFWDARTPAGVPVRREVVFAADDADPARSQPQVRRHVLRGAPDAKNPDGRVIGLAEVKAARTVSVGAQAVQYPTEIELRGEDAKARMVLKLSAAEVNAISPQKARGYFERPNINGVPAVDLRHAEFRAPGR